MRKNTPNSLLSCFFSGRVSGSGEKGKTIRDHDGTIGVKQRGSQDGCFPFCLAGEIGSDFRP